MPRILLALLLSLTLAATALFAQTAPSAPTGAATRPSPSSRPDEKPDPKISVTHHTLSLNGSPLTYDAAAGTITLKDDAGKPLADFFFIAYTRMPAGEPAMRPITFVFNGGPGAAAVWLHLGAVGPQRVKLGPDGIPGPPPHTLIPNDQTWLDTTDLVFIDPVGTGYSRPAEGQKASDFYGVKQDVDSVADFIRLYLTRYERWDSPKFLAGESYGTTRAAALSIKLAEDDGIDLNGIILISTVLDFQTLDATPGNDLPFALYLPSYTAIAVYHHKIATPDVQKLLDEVQQYAMHDYLDALAKGSALDPAARADVVDHLSRYTGLPADLIDKANLRIDPTMFRKQLLSAQRRHRSVAGQPGCRI
jgi:carboxypeptidase C (cathepsin A)